MAICWISYYIGAHTIDEGYPLCVRFHEKHVKHRKVSRRDNLTARSPTMVLA